jgi:YihY family inner membrane protein
MDFVDRACDRLPPTLAALVRSVREKEVLLYAGGLAFYGLVSIAPFLVISFWIAGFFVDEDGFRQLGEQIDDMTPSGTNMSGAIQSLATVGAGIGIGALVSALWPATAYGSGLVRAFDRVSEHGERDFKGAHGRLRALLFVVLLPAFLLGALGTSYVVAGLFGDGIWLTLLAWAAALVAGFVAAFLAIGTIYLVFGPGLMEARAIATGAGAAAAALAVTSLGFVVYLGQGADFEERVAGSGFAAVVLLSLWLYLANVILLLGYALACSASGDTPDPTEGSAGAERDEPDQGSESAGSSSEVDDSPSSISSTTGSRTSSRR